MVTAVINFLKRIPIRVGLSLLLGFHGLALAVDKPYGNAETFAIAKAHFEHNATDGDVEVVFEVKGGDEGLVRLTVVSPDGRTVIDFTAPDASTLGIRQFRFESPEPRDIESLKSSYPEGVYSFVGVTAAGRKLSGQSRLNHRLPATATFLHFGDLGRGVVARDLEITWRPVRNMAGYLIEIEQDELDVNITAKLPGSATAFAVPAGFLLPDTQYEFSIGTVTAEGNITFVETTFTTARNK